MQKKDTLMQYAAFPDGTRNAIGILCGKLKMQNFPEQTKRALEFVERVSEGGYGEKTEDFLPKLKTEAAKSGINIIGIENSRPFVMGGGTYARKIPNAVAFGPGQERNLDRLGLPKGHGNCHCADEAELFENLKNAVKIYVFALKKLDKRIKEIR